MPQVQGSARLDAGL